MDDKALAREAKERWGATDAYREAAARTGAYTKEQWAEIKEEADEIARAFADARYRGVNAVDVAERHRCHIDERYYPCPSRMHTRLGELYVADPRFSAYWDEYGEGLAKFVRDAIRANAGRSGPSPSA